jgi:hypothetical protein
MSSNLELIITGDIYSNILDYLDIRSIKNLLMTCKMIYYNRKNRFITKKIVHKRIYNIFYSIFKKYIFYCRIIHFNKDNIDYSPKILALYYYQHYPKDLISAMYRHIIGFFNVYTLNYTPNFVIKDQYSRYDLYNVIKSMRLTDTYSCGW